MRNRKRLGIFGTTIACLGSLLSSGCFSSRGGYDYENVKMGGYLVGLSVFSFACLPRQETQEGKTTLGVIGGLSLVMGGSLLKLEWDCSRPRYSELEQYPNFEPIKSEDFPEPTRYLFGSTTLEGRF